MKIIFYCLKFPKIYQFLSFYKELLYTNTSICFLKIWMGCTFMRVFKQWWYVFVYFIKPVVYLMNKFFKISQKLKMVFKGAIFGVAPALHVRNSEQQIEPVQKWTSNNLYYHWYQCLNTFFLRLYPEQHVIEHLLL